MASGDEYPKKPQGEFNVITGESVVKRGIRDGSTVVKAQDDFKGKGKRSVTYGQSTNDEYPKKGTSVSI